MTPEQRAAVLAEELPTGLFGGPRPAPPVRTRAIDPLAAQHVADLLAALDAHDAAEARRRGRLRLVTTEHDLRAAS